MPKKGYKQTEEHKKKGKIKTDIARKNISKSLEGNQYTLNKRWRVKDTSKMKGFRDLCHSEKTKRKISKNNEGKHNSVFSDEHKRKIKENHVGSLGKHWKHTEKWKKDQQKRMTGKHWKVKDTSNMKKTRTIEHKKNISKASIRRWQDSVYREKILLNLLKSKDSPNKTERRLNDILQQILPDEYKYVGDGEFFLARKCPDFMNINGKKKLIELFGDYWHKDENPQNRIDLFKEYGYNTLVVWEKELKDLERLKSKVLEFSFV
jgi:hypothetical protein